MITGVEIISFENDMKRTKNRVTSVWKMKIAVKSAQKFVSQKKGNLQKTVSMLLTVTALKQMKIASHSGVTSIIICVLMIAVVII